MYSATCDPDHAPAGFCADVPGTLPDLSRYQPCNEQREDTEEVGKGNGGGLTSPVNVHPGTSKCTPTFVSLKSKLKCSVSAFTAALLALYATFPGGFVMLAYFP
jgi:hypothetical protein